MKFIQRLGIAFRPASVPVPTAHPSKALADRLGAAAALKRLRTLDFASLSLHRIKRVGPGSAAPAKTIRSVIGNAFQPRTVRQRMENLLSFAKLALLGRPKVKAKSRPAAPAARSLAKPVAPPAQTKPRPVPDDGADEMRGTSPVAAARQRERARCAAIVNSPAGLLRPAMAQMLAFKTRMPRVEALAMLDASPGPLDRSAHYSARAARNPNVDAGMPTAIPQSVSVSKSLDVAFLKANPANARRLTR